MVRAVGEPSAEVGNPSSVSTSTSDVLSPSSLPRSRSNGIHEGLEAGRGRSPNRSTPTSSRMNSRGSLLGSRRESVFGGRSGFGNAYFQEDELGVYLSSVAVIVLMGIVAAIAARQYLNTIEADQDGRDLIIFDIDETSLSNMPYYVAHNYGVEAWGKASWNAWVNDASAPALDPMLSLYTDLRTQNWSVGFITGRPESQGQKTARNLYSAGYTGWVSLILRKPAEETLPAAQYKAKYRKMLESKGYRIRSSLGDQWSDLNGGNAGERTIKLPNPIYYIY